MSTTAPRALLEVRNLVKHFPIRRGVLSRVSGAVQAVNDITFTIARGQTLSLVGESGCGKTTAGRLIPRLLEPDAGEVVFDGVDVRTLRPAELRALRKRVQVIFQDPYGSLNPRMTVYSVLAEALAAHGLAPRRDRRRRVDELLGMVGMPADAAGRYPSEFSGGQRQRIGIARALAVEPDLIIADEPVSALDVSIQAQILNLLEELQDRLGLTYLFISHDLRVVRHISDHVAVMYLGRIVETGPVDDVFDHPVHPYTRALLSAVPVPDPAGGRSRILLPGSTPSAAHPPSGCPFHPRCVDAQPACARTGQRLVEVAPGHLVACAVHAPAPSPEMP